MSLFTKLLILDSVHTLLSNSVILLSITMFLFLCACFAFYMEQLTSKVEQTLAFIKKWILGPWVVSVVLCSIVPSMQDIAKIYIISEAPQVAEGATKRVDKFLEVLEQISKK